MTNLVLYEHPLSPYAQKCKIALYEKGVSFDVKTPTAIGTGQVDTAFLVLLAVVPNLLSALRTFAGLSPEVHYTYPGSAYAHLIASIPPIAGATYLILRSREPRRLPRAS